LPRSWPISRTMLRADDHRVAFLAPQRRLAHPRTSTVPDGPTFRLPGDAEWAWRQCTGSCRCKAVRRQLPTERAAATRDIDPRPQHPPGLNGATIAARRGRRLSGCALVGAQRSRAATPQGCSLRLTRTGDLPGRQDCSAGTRSGSGIVVGRGEPPYLRCHHMSSRRAGSPGASIL
jgi:hypothetical protein